MIEHAPFESPEVTSHPQEVYPRLRTILDADGPLVRLYRQGLDEETRAQPDYHHLDVLEEQELAAQRASYSLEQDESAHAETVLARIRQDRASIGDEAVDQWQDTRGRRGVFERRHEMITVAGSPIAQEAMELVWNAVPANPDDSARAPFRGYRQNDEHSWQAVPDSEARDFLARRRFIPEEVIEPRRAEDSYNLRINAGDAPIDVPADLFVDANGFESWQGRGHGGRGQKAWHSKYGDGLAASLDTIKHYAGLESDIPSVGEVHIYIQPDGLALAGNGSGDSHRLAAALLRGQQYIPARSVRISLLDVNVAELTRPLPQSGGPSDR